MNVLMESLWNYPHFQCSNVMKSTQASQSDMDMTSQFQLSVHQNIASYKSVTKVASYTFSWIFMISYTIATVT